MKEGKEMVVVDRVKLGRIFNNYYTKLLIMELQWGREAIRVNRSILLYPFVGVKLVG